MSSTSAHPSAAAPTVESLHVDTVDGVRLAVDVYRPDHPMPVAAVVDLENPHDAGIGAWPGARGRLVEAGFAVVVVHARASGASTGRRSDDRDHVDLAAVVDWAATRSWCTGRVGAIGAGRGALAVLAAAVGRPDHLGAAVVAHVPDIATDEYFRGGVLRAMALLRTGAAALAASVRPPDAQRWSELHRTDWTDEWARRVADADPELLRALRAGRPSPDERSLSTGPEGSGMQRIGCPVMVVSGWVDGHSDIALRSAGHMPNFRLIAGPWGDGDPANTRPGPSADMVREVVRHFDQHLRGGPRAAMRRGQLFVRRPAPPRADLDDQPGEWVEIDVWPPVQLREEPRRTRADHDEVDEVAVVGDVGVNSADSRVGEMPWGMPLDQLPDNARSVTYDWMHRDEVVVIGIAEVTMQVRTSVDAAQVSVKLCDIAPDGTSTLVTRGMLDLSQRGRWPADPFGEPGAPAVAVPTDDWIDVRIPFEATTWTLLPGHRLRLAITGGDWPNCWPPRFASTLGVRRGSVRVVLWSARGLPPARDTFVSPDTVVDHAGQAEWRYEYDVLRRRSLVHIAHETTPVTVDGLTVDRRLSGTLSVDTARPALARLDGAVDEHMSVDGRPCRTATEVHVHSDEREFVVELTVVATIDAEIVAERRWVEAIPRA